MPSLVFLPATRGTLILGRTTVKTACESVDSIDQPILGSAPKSFSARGRDAADGVL